MLTMWHPLSAKKLALTSLTSSGHSVGIVRLQTEATEFVLFVVCLDSDMLLPVFLEFWKCSWKPFFHTSVNALIVFAVSSLVLMNHLFRTLFSHGKRESQQCQV
jgi:hypothetical protein